MGLTIAVIGSRSFSDWELLQATLQEYEIKEIISGGAIGADTLARKYAETQGIPLTEHKPDYKTWGKKAPLERNKMIVQECDQVIAFWDGKSRGTAHAIRTAERMGKPVQVVRF
jgi:predicted Rossmann fold nucleotide-binding protein DprA/Smf involved in DNA uptake